MIPMTCFIYFLLYWGSFLVQSVYVPGSFATSSVDPQSVDEEDDGGQEAKMQARDVMYGANYIDQPGYASNYIDQVANHMAAETVGGIWTSLGPTYTAFPNLDSGRIRSILPHPIVKSTLYALFAGGGLWKTTNLFDTQPVWTPLTDFLTTTSGGFAALGSNPDTIYLVMGDPYDNVGVGGLFSKSTDGGITWSASINLSSYSTNGYRVTRGLHMVVDTSSGSDIILISTNVGILRSTDGGVSFTNPYAFNGYSTSHGINSLVKTSIGWIGHLWYNQILLYSTDRGVSWSTVPGSNWNTITSSNAGRVTFSVGATAEATVYALVAKYSDSTTLNIYKSTNGGVTWTALNCNSNYVPTNSNPYLQTDLDILGDQGWYDQMLLVDPSDSTRNTVYAGGSLVSIRTTNGGSSWTLISTWYDPDYFTYWYGLNYVHADFHAAAYLKSPTGVNTLIFGTDGGLFISSDKGSTWSSKLNQGLVTQLPNFICGSPPLNDKVMIGLQDLGTREYSSGTTWASSYGGDGDGCGYGQAVNKVNIISLYYNIFKCRYYSGGSFGSFSSCTSGITEADTDRPFYTNLRTPSATADPTGTIFFTLTDKSVYRSYLSSGVIVWSKIGTIGVGGISSSTFPECLQAIGIGPTTTNQVAVAKGSQICITTNGGTSWTTVTVSSYITSWSSSISPLWVSSTVLYLASESATLGRTRFIKSTDTGSTWSAPSTVTKLPDVPLTRLVLHPSDSSGNTVIACTWIGVYITTDGGVNWNVLGLSLPNVAVSDIYLGTNKMFISTYGRGVWSLSLSFASLSPTTAPTQTPSQPTSIPTVKPTREPSMMPTTKPTTNPTARPTRKPTSEPSTKPSREPTISPSRKPTTSPSTKPTTKPSYTPSTKPSKEPTVLPSRNPTFSPSTKPTAIPTTSKPSKTPTISPTKPTLTPSTSKPSRVPTVLPSRKPTFSPSTKPTVTPTTSKPSRVPTISPSRKPSREPTTKPTRNPSVEPSTKPTKAPSSEPSRKPF